MRVAIVFDMEGVAHIGDLRETLPLYPEYWSSGRAKLTNDVAAAARGLLDEGVDEVSIVSHHGAGENPWPNLLDDRLPDGARSVDWETKELPEHVDAMLQVGCHARGGSPSFMSHTFLPGFRSRIGDELMSESHEWAFNGGVPVLGIVGSEALGRERGPSLANVPFLAVQSGEDRSSARPVFDQPDETEAAIRAFAASAVRDAAGMRPLAPRDIVLRASLHNAEDVADEMIEGGWTRVSATEFEHRGADWRELDDRLWEAVALSYRPLAWVFPTITWTETEASALDGAFLERVDELLSTWVRTPYPEWYGPEAPRVREGGPDPAAVD